MTAGRCVGDDGRVVSPIWARRPNILKIDNLWKTQIQKFKTPKQAIKFV